MAIKVYLLTSQASNWRSVRYALLNEGFTVSVVSVTEIASLPQSSVLVLPGVGNIKHLSEQFSNIYVLADLAKNFREKNIGIIGICLGFQFLCRSSSEDNGSPCLSMLNLDVEALFTPSKPSVGWKYIAPEASNEGVESIERVLAGGCFYFTHCYGVISLPAVLDGLTIYSYDTSSSSKAVAAVVSERIIGLQFHPEKSGTQGANALKSAIYFLSAGST